ncbi:MAG: hypothetical protein S4CHLAM6_04610 [Chlamydiae bacterium]|nr:hypothetical protein [Chlamydiota bacterium]
MNDLDFKIYKWVAGLFLGGYHLALLILMPLFFIKFGVPTLGIIISSFVLFVASGLSITGGYHRYFSHRSFKTNPVIECILLFFGAIAVQGSALRWSFDHRQHHAFVDTDDDPYSINRGFWYAHFIWFFDKPKDIDPKLCSDLLRNKRVMFQHNYYGTFTIIANFILIGIVGLLFHNFLAAFIFAGLFRLFLLHHFTWFINSLAHTWGSKTYSKEHTAVDNYIVSLVTFGEGYHNYHHTFCSDYRNGVRWFHFDPTKWLIWVLGKLRLAKDLRTTEIFKMKEKQILYDRKFLLKKLKQLIHVNQKLIEEKVSTMSQTLLDTLSSMRALSANHGKLKNNLKDAAPVEELERLDSELQSLKNQFEDQWKNWLKLSSQILRKKESKLAA